MRLGMLLKSVTRLYIQRFEQRARALGLTLPQCRVLVYLAREEGQTQAQLSELIEVDPMTLVRILDRMEADGWVERRADPQDRRARRLFLMPKARPVLDRIEVLVDQTRDEALEGMPRAQSALLLKLLERMQSNLSREVSTAAAVPAAAGTAGAAAAGRREPSR